MLQLSPEWFTNLIDRRRESHKGSGQNTNRVDGRAADVTFVIENVIVVLLTVRQAILFPVLIRS